MTMLSHALEGGTRPAALQKGDTIAFVSPSSRVNDIFPQRVERAKAFFESLGYPVKVIFTATLSNNWLESLQQRAEEIHSAFRDPCIRCIISTIGGLSANELLPHLDYSLIAANPKIFCGYSDMTLLHHAFYTQANLRTFYGPAAITQFGEYPEPLSYTISHFLRTVNGEFNAGAEFLCSSEWTQEHLDWNANVQRPRTLQPSPKWKWLRQADTKAEGRLFGGCLPSLLQLYGTKYFPDYTGAILFLETPELDKPDSAFGPEFARSALADLRNAGVLEVIAGLLLGRPYQYDEAMCAEFEAMVVHQCYGTSFPILANADVGHTDPILTLPLGALVALDSRADRFVVLEEVVES